MSNSSPQLPLLPKPHIYNYTPYIGKVALNIAAHSLWIIHFFAHKNNCLHSCHSLEGTMVLGKQRCLRALQMSNICADALAWCSFWDDVRRWATSPTREAANVECSVWSDNSDSTQPRFPCWLWACRKGLGPPLLQYCLHRHKWMAWLSLFHLDHCRVPYESDFSILLCHLCKHAY